MPDIQEVESPPGEQSTKDFAKHSSVGSTVAIIDKAIKKNPAMSVGEFWKYSLRALVNELHEYHIDYTDAAVEDVEGSDVDPEYVEALIEFVSEDTKELIAELTSALMRAYKKTDSLDANGQPDDAKLSAEDKVCRDKLVVWTAKYAELIDEPPEEPPADGNGVAEVTA